ncbi:MAG: MSHA biogenesis protein MshL [Candidatus Azotimanducaceae bacterium]|jgi:MSHA biogenesis protein MshL
MRKTQWIMHRVMLTASFLFGLGGCVTMETMRQTDSQIEALVASIDPVPEMRKDTVRKEEKASKLLEVFKNKNRFDVAAVDVPISIFLMSLVEESPYNMVVHPEVDGFVSLELRQVLIAEVLEILQQTNNLYVELSGSIISVLPNQLQTRIFTLDYVNLQRNGISEMRVSTGSIMEAGSGGNSNNQNSNNQNSNNANESNGGNQGSSEVVGSRVRTENTSKLWSDLRLAIKSIIGSRDGRNVVVMEQAGVIVVRAMSNEIASVASFLAMSERSLQRQVILEAKILEVALSQSFQSGIDWSELGQISGADGGLVSTALDGPRIQNPDGLGGVFGVGLQLTDFTGIMELLETQGVVKVLSSPRIATINNQKAVIKVGTDEFFVTDVTSTTTTGNATTTTPSVTLTPFFSGIALDVTPQISRSGDVILHIHPTVSEVNDQTKVVTIGDDTVNLPLALSTIRESDSIVRAKNNQVIVIGGLMKSSGGNQTAGPPGFGGVPGLGFAFSQKRKNSQQSELVILVRPIVLDEQKQYEQVSDSLQRISKMGF